MKPYFIRLLQLALLVIHIPALAEETRQPLVTVTQAYIELHTGPGRGYPIFYVVERGEKVELLKQRTDWIKVRTMPRGPMRVDSDGKLIKGSNTQQGWVRVEAIVKTADENGDSIDLGQPRIKDYADRQWEEGMMAGDFGGANIISAYMGYHFARNLSVELELSQNFGNFSSGQSWAVSIVHEPFPSWRLSPFFIMGGGELKTNPRSTIVATKDRTNNFLAVGGGLRYYLSDHFLLRLQYRRHTILIDQNNEIKVEEWKIGLSAYF